MKDEIQFKTFSLKVDDLQDDGMIRGYASTFGNVDQGYDIVEKGAFKKSIKETKGVWPILADHNPSDQIGWNMRASEDDHGLKVEGQIDLNTQKGREKYSLAKKAKELGTNMGLSIGYFTIKWDYDRDQQEVRRLKELKLMEYSIVTFPMNTLAMITNLKAAASMSRDMQANEIKLALEQWKRLGYTKQDFETALQNVFGAATKNYDPVKLNQSLDSLTTLLKERK